MYQRISVRFALFALVTLCGPAFGSPAGAYNDSRPSLEDYFQIHRVRGASFSYDEKLIAYETDIGGRMDIWVQPTAGGQARQITRVKGAIHSFAFSPVEDLLLYEADEGGNDAPRLYLTNSSGRAPEELLPDYPKGSRIGFIGWAEDGQSFLYITHLPGQNYTVIHEYDLRTRHSQEVWKSNPRLSFAMASPDFRKLILLEVLSDVNFNLYLLKRGESEPVLITPHEGHAAYKPTGFSKDSQTLFFTSTEKGEFAALYAMDLNTRESRAVHTAEWDVEDGRYSAGGNYFITVTDEDGSPRVEVREAHGGKRIDLPSPDGDGTLVPVHFSASDRYVAATLVSDISPASLYLVDLKTGAARELVQVLREPLRGKTMVASKAVRIRSFDQLKVPTFVYEPGGKGPFPAVVLVHGGPTSQAQRRFTPIRQYLVSKGFVVLVPNVRGSTGYGKTYTTLDNLDLGGAPLKDVVACKDWLVENRHVDPDRVVIMGASYGGYMALAAAAFAPTVFAAHVDFFGPSDLKALVESYPPYWITYAQFTFKKWGNPKDPAHAEYQYQRSPLHFVDQIQRPLLIVQGENDARVPREQSDRLVSALQKRNIPVEYLVIPGEGHGFSRVENQVKAYRATDRFLDRYIFQNDENEAR